MLSDPSRLPFRTDITVGDLKFALNVNARYDVNGIYDGNVLEWMDVTELRTQQGQLAAIDRAQAVIEFSLDGKVLNANANFLQLLGYTMDEIRGQHHGILVDPAYRASAEYRCSGKSWAVASSMPASTSELEKAAVRSGSRRATIRFWTRTAKPSEW